ncbi:MAG: hypothetical protein MUO76_00580, partial [Anaerolineaceae bacterium]|nr:hypothetical protein [Anaerolineaceae bacterium]
MIRHFPVKAKTNIFVLLVFIFSLFPTACIPKFGFDLSDPFINWTFADLLLLEGADSDNPGRDLLAVYARQSETFEIRLDFLEISYQITFDLYLAIDNQAGGTRSLPINIPSTINWDTLVKITPDQNIDVFSSDGLENRTLSRQMIVDSALDSLILQLGNEVINDYTHNVKLEVFISTPGSDEIDDISFPFSLQPLTRVPQAPILLAFWDTFPAQTPAQALRRWNGAHTGPFGRRHGLSHLLQMSHEHAIPITLLDLRTPNSLSALEFIGQLEFIRELERQKLIILPDPAFGDPQIPQISLDFSRQISHDLGLPSSQIVFASLPFSDVHGYSAAYADLKDRHHIQEEYGVRYIPLPSPLYPPENSVSEIAEKIITQDGLTVDIKKTLIKIALDDDPANLLVLGGSLPSSAWADAVTGSLLFRYLAAHPWIKVLDQDELLSLDTIPLEKPMEEWEDCFDLLCTPPPPSTEQLPVNMDIHERQISLLQNLPSSPQGVFTEQAWQTYLTLTKPGLEPAHSALMTGYLDIVDTLLYAAQWEHETHPISKCDQEICILASENLYLVLDLAGGYVRFSAWRNPTGVTQIIAPVSQFAAGLSDPSEWEIKDNKIIDPADIPGAFIGPDHDVIHYEAISGINQISLHDLESHTVKTFSTQNDMLNVS